MVSSIKPRKIERFFKKRYGRRVDFAEKNSVKRHKTGKKLKKYAQFKKIGRFNTYLFAKNSFAFLC